MGRRREGGREDGEKTEGGEGDGRGGLYHYSHWEHQAFSFGGMDEMGEQGVKCVSAHTNTRASHTQTRARATSDFLAGKNDTTGSSEISRVR